MAKLDAYYNGTVATGTPVTLEVEEDTPYNREHYEVHSYRIDATGAGTLQIETKAKGASAFNVQSSISGESVILDFVALQEIKLTASTANVPVTIAPYSSTL